MNSIVDIPVAQKTINLVKVVYAKLDFLAPLSNLAIRLWVANVFFKSGLTKIQTWDSTLYLFENEYSVPLLPPDFAAILASGIELGFPVLLALGFLGRFAAFVLFVFNIIAVISYPELNPAGVVQHQMWGIMLLVPLLQGPGKISVDCFLKRTFKL